MASLSAIDYVVFGLVLVISAAIGFYHAWEGVTRTEEFFVANRQMKFLPVSFSLLASWISSISILRISSETYTYGSMYMYVIATFAASLVISAHFAVPVFYGLKLSSVYEVGQFFVVLILKIIVYSRPEEIQEVIYQNKQTKNKQTNKQTKTHTAEHR